MSSMAQRRELARIDRYRRRQERLHFALARAPFIAAEHTGQAISGLYGGAVGMLAAQLPGAGPMVVGGLMIATAAALYWARRSVTERQ